MCGSGTIPIEAALYAANIPSQIKRTYFAFKFWKNYDKAMWDKIKEEEKSKIKEQLDVKIYASDRDGRILDVAKNNIKSAKVESYIELKHSSMEELQLPEGKKHIIVNPPYGRRLSVDVVKVYKSLGDVLRRYKGSEAWVFTDKREKLELMGLKPKEKYKIKTGAVSGYFYGYDIF
jgi:putative N6-adenine-specific DNA methylase